MTMSVRRELCAVMVFAVVERAGTIVLNDGEEVCLYVEGCAVNESVLKENSNPK